MIYFISPIHIFEINGDNQLNLFAINISDGLSNAQIIQKARELKAKAEQELSKSCVNQYTVTSTISAIIAQKSFVYNGVVVNDD